MGLKLSEKRKTYFFVLYFIIYICNAAWEIRMIFTKNPDIGILNEIRKTSPKGLKLFLPFFWIITWNVQKIVLIHQRYLCPITLITASNPRLINVVLYDILVHLKVLMGHNIFTNAWKNIARKNRKRSVDRRGILLIWKTGTNGCCFFFTRAYTSLVTIIFLKC